MERREVYRTSQLVNCYRDFTGVSGIRATDLRSRLESKFVDKIHFEKTGGKTRDPEYILPSGVNLTASCIKSAESGGALSTTASIRNMARTLHKELVDAVENQNQWPPTPNDNDISLHLKKL